jgi:hypothetical protein
MNDRYYTLKSNEFMEITFMFFFIKPQIPKRHANITFWSRTKFYGNTLNKDSLNFEQSL